MPLRSFLKRRFLRSDIMLSKTVTLTNDQILTLPTTPVELVPAPGIGKLIRFLGATLIIDARAGAYTVDTNASFNVFYEGFGSFLNTLQQATVLGFTTNRRVVNLFPGYLRYFAGGDLDSIPIAKGDGDDVPSCENKALMLGDAWWGVSNYTGGNVNNSMIVNVFYTIINV